MAVPSRVTEKMKKLEIAQKRVDERKRNDKGDLANRQAVAADRNARRQLLLDLCLDVFEWRDAFAKSREGQRFWSLLGNGARVMLYAGWFWDGLPVEVNPIGAHTRVFLEGIGHHFLLEEWRNDAQGRPETYREVCRLKSPLEMLEHPQMHPSMIEGLQTHLSGPEAWEHITNELDRWLERYNAH